MTSDQASEKPAVPPVQTTPAAPPSAAKPESSPQPVKPAAPPPQAKPTAPPQTKSAVPPPQANPAPPPWIQPPRSPSTRQVRLLAQAIALEEGRPPRTATLAVGASAALFCAALGWAALTQVERMAVAPGQIVPSGQVQSVQHLEGGIVREILAQEGAVVARDDILLRLEPTGMQAELDQLRAREAGLALQIERLRAFAEHRPAQLAGAGHGRQVASDQEAVLRMQVQARDSQRAVLERQLASREAELATAHAQRTALQRQEEIVGESAALRRKLLEKDLVSRLTYLDTAREHARLRGEVAQAESGIHRAQAGVAEAQARLIEADAKLASDSLAEMGRLSAELAQVREGIARAVDRVDRLDIRAPVSGVVKDLRHRTVGGVIAPGAAIVDIVPVEQDLVAEIRISPRDVGHVRVGQPVTAKISTFDFARYGVVPGRLKTISATTFQEADGQLAYRGTVRLERRFVGDDPRRNALLPGMVLQADIRLGGRSVLEYLFTPVYASLASALHER